MNWKILKNSIKMVFSYRLKKKININHKWMFLKYIIINFKLKQIKSKKIYKKY